ncbi:fatty acid desaturase [Laspinema olomoucense]|uniref:fatty acid desaturase n=1 Tax=Laspinema olomoucense TaxID=3231600 RepID=UPI0021BB0B97|nr:MULTISPECIES: fatty acid desaturase [unclassified Laspinema]MCT7972962.1 hypothetical protein [Laspinema sp. D3d]MCT7987067.1 hypothetical protein [Laspinema sp. D3a]
MTHKHETAQVREKLARLGLSWPKPLYHLLQEGITWLTGKPYWGKQPLLNQTPWTHLATACLSLFGGAAVAWAIATSSPRYWLLLPLPWLFVVGAARKLHTNLYHQSVHWNFSRNKIGDRIFGEIISTLLLNQDFEAYRRDHIEDHHGKNFATAKDPDAEFLLELGFAPGMRDDNP